MKKVLMFLIAGSVLSGVAAYAAIAKPAIPPKQNEAPVACPDWIYTHRNQVERLWARLKEWRAVATRYEKTARSFMGVLCLAAAMDWIRR